MPGHNVKLRPPSGKPANTSRSHVAMPHGRTTLTRTLAFVAVLGLLALSHATPARAADNPVVILETSVGPISIELDATKAPITVENFLKYVDLGHYNNTI